MSLFYRHATITPPEELIPPRPGTGNGSAPLVDHDSALRHSAVWACLRIRADLVSTMPVDVYRYVNGIQVEAPKPPVLVNPGGERVDIQEWLYSSQIDLDRAGNAFGIITEVNALGLPARIDLQPLAECSVIVRDGELWRYRIAGKLYEPHQVWHEKQFTVGGLPVGLSPVAYAAWSIGEYLSVQKFALDWFTGSAIPAAALRNSEKTISRAEADAIKERFRASVANGDIFVHGKDWEYKPIQALANQTNWIEAKQFGLTDISRFFGCPADLIDAAVSSGSVTYANITQRNLQFLIMNLGPAVSRREHALSKLVPGPRFVKFNRSALLAMDPETRARTLETRIRSRQLAPSEARALEDLPPFTDEQLAEFDRLFGAPRKPTEAKA